MLVSQATAPPPPGRANDKTGQLMYIAQLNIAHLRAPVSDPMIADFTNALDRINGLGDAAPGNVWRFIDDCREVDNISPWGPEIIANLTVWEDIDSLKAFAFRGEHMALMRRRRDWFHPMPHYSVLWWVADDERPTLTQAKARLDHLAEHGPSAHAFTFGTARSFPQPSTTLSSTPDVSPRQ